MQRNILRFLPDFLAHGAEHWQYFCKGYNLHTNLSNRTCNALIIGWVTSLISAANPSAPHRLSKVISGNGNFK